MPPERSAAPGPALSVIDGVAMMVGIVIGIGIFKTPPLVAQNVGSEAAFLGVWLLGGLVTLIGALCYAELASSHPHAGGEYHFLSRGLGRSVAILFGWARGTVIQTGAIAAVAFVLGDYANQILPLGVYGSAVYAALGIVALTGLNVLGTPQSKAMQVGFTFVTIATVGIIIAAGLFAGPSSAPAAPTGGSGGAFGMAMIFVLLTYGGWSEAAYLSAEMREGRRSIVRVLVLGTIVIAALYILVNLAFLSVFGLGGLRASNAPAADMMRVVAGETGALVLGLVVVAAALSTLNATIFTGARVYYAMGRDLPGLARLGIWSERGHNPANALILQGAIALALVAFGAASRNGFQSMVDYTAPVFWTALFLVGVSLFVLRFREPDRERPFRVPLYPLTPALFCATSLGMLYSSLAYTGTGALVGIAVVLAGVPLLALRPPSDATVPAE